MKVWLDDERPAPPGWHRARTVGDVVDLWLTALGNGEAIEELSLDHDLGSGDETGYDVLLWIERELHADWYLGRLPKLFVHSANPPARKRMEAAIAAIEKAALSA